MTNLVETALEKLAEEKNEMIVNRIPQRYLGVDIKEVESFKLGKNYYIWGGVGTGKTRKAYGLLKKDIEQVYEMAVSKTKEDTDSKYAHNFYPRIQFFNFPKMLQYIRNGIGEKKEYSDTLNIQDISEEKRIVIIDDLGAEKFTEWVVETLYQIINERYERMLPTILISNLSLQELAEKVGDRITSRIAEMCEIVKLDGKDKRLN